MKFWAPVFAFILLVFAAGCGSSRPSGSSIFNPPPVEAQTTYSYSNASVSGTYSIMLVSGDVEVDYGSFKADGNGNISSGTLTMSQSGSAVYSCTAAFTGTYSIKSDATGTASISTAPDASNSCVNQGMSGQVNNTLSYDIQVAQQGSFLQLAPAHDNKRWAPGTAAKQ